MTQGQAQPQVRTYYDTPVLKDPEWTWEVPWYLFFGGMGGASSVLAGAAALRGNDRLARAARMVAAASAAVSPPLLISDLGRPGRFLNMLRVFKPTSAMSVGSWILAAYTPAALASVGLQVLDRLPRLRALADAGAAALGSGMATYTAVLIADSSIPVWHEARDQLPALFASSAAASAGAAAVLLTDPDAARPARRLAVAGAAGELVADRVMQSRLGEHARVYERPGARGFHKAAAVCTSLGGVLVALGGRRRGWLAKAGAALLLAGSACQRWSVYKAGFTSARDPRYVVGPQRGRLDRGEGVRTDPTRR